MKVTGGYPMTTFSPSLSPLDHSTECGILATSHPHDTDKTATLVTFPPFCSPSLHWLLFLSPDYAVWFSDQHQLGSCWKRKVSGSPPNLLHQNLHFNRIVRLCLRTPTCGKCHSRHLLPLCISPCTPPSMSPPGGDI